MIKLKYKEDGSITLKGLNGYHLDLIAVLVNSVRLGDETHSSKAAFDLCEFFEQEMFPEEEELTLVVVNNKNDKHIEDFTLEVNHV
jgi:hypothetical protein